MKKKLKSLKIFLMVVTLTGCASKLPQFPTPTVKQPLFKKNITNEYEFKDNEFKFKEVHPLEFSNGMFCITPEEYQQIRRWVIKVNTEFTCKENATNNPVVGGQ